MATPDGYEELYDYSRGSWEGSRQAVEDAGQSAMDWIDEYYKTPEQIDLVSENLDNLLDPNSAYMVEAQKKSREAREESGYLESGFNVGMGTVAAIDNAFNTTLSDTYVDMYNANAVNERNRQEYVSAYDAVYKALVSQGEQSYKEMSYDLIVNKLDEYQNDLLELQDKEYEYADLLQQDQHEADIDAINLKNANDLANRILRNKTGLQAYYLNAYANIIGSDIAQVNKYDQLVGLGNQITQATKQAVDSQSMNVGDNPYGVSFIDYLPEYDQGSRTDEVFVWSKADADKEFKEVWNIVNNIRGDIYNQTSHAERNESSLWTVLNDMVYSELSSIDKNSKNYKDKMEYFNRLKYEKLGNEPSNQEIEDFFRNMYLIGKTVKTGNDIVPNYFMEPEVTWGIEYPHYEIKYNWDSPSESIIQDEIFVDGNAAYYEELYKSYEAAQDSIFPPDKPAGYDEWKQEQQYNNLFG